MIFMSISKEVSLMDCNFYLLENYAYIFLYEFLFLGIAYEACIVNRK